MFDAFKQAGAMAGIMKELPKLQARAKEIAEMLDLVSTLLELFLKVLGDLLV